MNAVDTNVFVYALDVDEPTKQAQAQDLFQRLALATGSTVLPWQVAGEQNFQQLIEVLGRKFQTSTWPVRST